MTDANPCPHKLLKKQIVAGHFWYACCECRQKFRVEPWDGRVEVVNPERVEVPVEMRDELIAGEAAFARRKS